MVYRETTNPPVATGDGMAAAWRAGAFSPAASSGAGQRAAAAPATAVVTRQDIAATTPVTATLGYAGSYSVRGQGGGKLTWLPLAGRVIRQGHALYKTDNGSPVVLLYGSVPDWRPLGEGVTGADVSQLNHDLVALGDADSVDISALGWEGNSLRWIMRRLENRFAYFSASATSSRCVRKIFAMPSVFSKRSTRPGRNFGESMSQLPPGRSTK